MTAVSTNPQNIANDVKFLRAGDILELEECDYRSPVFIDGLGGTASKPITIRSRGGARFTSAETFSAAKSRINKLVKRRQESGYFPSIGQTADEAWLILRNCRYIVVESLNFEGCWPGSIYVDQSQNITVRDVHFLEGTIAIGVNGKSSRDILVEDCTWQQDVSAAHDMWKTIPWTRIHGHKNNAYGGDGTVNVREDYRLYDGDFFRAWEMPGNVTIRNNYIKDAFNGIHFFNRRSFDSQFDKDGSLVAGPPNGAANVVIENNTFERIRDNIIEPEEGAWNWVIRHNAFLDFYRLFSLEMQFGGFFYVYGNVGWQRNLPGPRDSKGNTSAGSLLKLGNETVGVGPFYFFHNSWILEGRLASKNSIRGLYHANNLIDFVSSSKGNPSKGKLLGDLKIIQGESDVLKKTGTQKFNEERAFLEPARFTSRWDSLGIQSDGDTIHHLAFPDVFQSIGMQFGKASTNDHPAFIGGDDIRLAFQTRNPISSIALSLEMPFGSTFNIKPVKQRGAVQSDGKLFQLSKEFRWLDRQNFQKIVEYPGRIS